MSKSLRLSTSNELPADWLGKQVKVKGLLNGMPEVLTAGELVGVSSVGAVLSHRGHRSFWPWSTVYCMRLEEEGAA